MIIIKYLPILALTMAVVDGFAFSIFDAFKASPLLSDISEYKMGDKFEISMDVGEKDQQRMNLNGLTIEFLQQPAEQDQKVGLPGCDGPHPQTSTGALTLKVHSTPSFIDMYGTQKVRFEKPCYEMIWKKDMHSGQIVCGFNLPTGANRNGANIPAGRLYLTFTVWEPEGLTIRQADRFAAESKAKEFAHERDEELQKYATEPNFFKKALHYRNAIAAVEKIDFTGISYLKDVPSADEVVPIGNGLLLETKGSIWTKGAGFLGGKHALLGDATLTPVLEDSEKVLRP